jgi:hypothetical protein
MSIRLLTVALMASSVAFATQSYAQTLPFGGISAGPAERTTTVKSSKSNTSDRMGGGGGGKGAAQLKLAPERPVRSQRMGGGGGGKGAVR